MSLMDDIRAVMKRASGPMLPQEVHEQLDTDEAVSTVRARMHQAATQGAGLERHDDGSYSLIPNWAPKLLRSGNDSTAAEAAPVTAAAETLRTAEKPVPAPKPRPAKAAKLSASRRGRKPGPKPGRAAAPAPTARRVGRPRKATAAPARQPEAAGAGAAADVVQIPRGVLRTLVTEVLESGRPVSENSRQALLALIRPAA